MSLSHRTRVATVVVLGGLTLALSSGPAAALEPVPAVSPDVAVESVESVESVAAETTRAAIAPTVEPVVERLVGLMVQSLAPPAELAPLDALSPISDEPPLDTVTALVDAVIGLVEQNKSLPPVLGAPTAPAPDPQTAPERQVTPESASGPAVLTAPTAPTALTPSRLAFALPRGALAGDGGPDAVMFGSIGRLARELTAGDDVQTVAPLAAPVGSTAAPLTASELFPTVAPGEEFLPIGSGSPTSLPALLVAVAAIAVAVSAGGHAAEVRRRRGPVVAG